MSDIKMLTYKGMPIVRRGNMVYYGKPTDKYMILLMIEESSKLQDLDLSKTITIQLLMNGNKQKTIKQAKREGMFAAMDIAEYWLNDALENG